MVRHLGGSHDRISVQSKIYVKVNWVRAKSMCSEIVRHSSLTSPIMLQAQRSRTWDKFLKLFRSGSSREASPAPSVGTTQSHSNPTQEVHLQSQYGPPSPWKMAVDSAQFVLSSLDRCLDGMPIASNVVGALNVFMEIANVSGLTIMAAICMLNIR